MAFRNPLLPTRLTQGDITDVIKNSRSVTMRGSDFSDKPVGTTSSFFYDPPGQGLKSTQQLNIDWSKFENHTFFNSAEVNTNIAFDKMINFYPFDGSRIEVEKFFEKLTGFEKYIFDRFPKNNGYLHFSGSYISINDYAGGLFPDISKNKTGESVLTPDGSFTFEFQLFLPTVTNDVSIILQKVSGINGITSFVSSSTDSTTALVGMSVTSGSLSLVSSATLDKGKFHHLAFIYDKNDGTNFLTFYKNGESVSKSSSKDIGRILMDGSVLTIGSGTQFRIDSITATPRQTLSGALDELRFFHSARTIEQIKENAYKGIFSTEDLKLYYKFNEPTGSYGTSSSDNINSIVLDSSGNSLHSFVVNYNHSLRSTGSIPVPLSYEKVNLCPVLFPGHEDVISLNEDLLLSASAYDSVNPNIITKLIPSHYILQGRESSGFDSDMGPISNPYGGTSIPGNGKLGQTQLLLSLLYVYAKFFDEIKLYIDAFARSEDADYDPYKSTSDHFLPLLFKKWGINVPAFFVDSSIDQYVDAENIRPIISTDNNSLQYIQNQILRRILANMNDIIKSKGTQHSVRSFLRSMGFDPENSFRIKEYGGPTRRNLSYSRETKNEIGKMVDFFSGGFMQTSGYLSSSRIEIGYPEIRSVSSYVRKDLFGPHGISNNANDGLWTSGSWTYEGLYKFPQGRLTATTQSLARIQSTGSNATAQPGLVFNLLAITGSDSERVILYGRPGWQSSTDAPLLTMALTGTNVFDGNLWNISFGKSRNDENQSLSSSYYLRAARQSGGQITSYITQSYFKEILGASNPEFSALCSITSSLAVSGTFLAIGSASIPDGITANSYSYLNDRSLVSNEARSTLFEGQIAQMRFWSKSVSEVEWKEHIKNPKSFGVQNPSTNFNFNVVPTGSFNRLRIDVAMDQQNRTTNQLGNINFTDFSQNNRHMVGSNFPANKNIFSPVSWTYDYISPNFDDGVTNEKVRVRSYQSYEKVQETPWAQVSPVHQINPSEVPMDDPRFSIEFSLVDSLNKDIINIFSTLDAIDNAIGSPNLMFGSDYPDLESLKNVYFNRLTEQINLNKFFEMYRWFDTSVSSFIESIIPRKTKFLGTNFVVESHMLERHKKEYFHSEMYSATNDRHNIQNVLLLQEIHGTVKKH